MSHAIDLGPIARVADGAISEFSIVKLTAANGVAQAVAAAASVDMFGVVMEIKSNVGSSSFGDAAAAGDVVDVHFHGVVRVKTGGTFAVGAALKADTAGLAVAGTAGSFVILEALEACTDAGQIIYAVIRKYELET